MIRAFSITPIAVEPLEPRRMLAGVTIVTHGFNSGAEPGSWADRMGEAVAQRAGGAAQYTLTITGTSSAPTAYTFAPDAGSPTWNEAGDAANPSGELVIKLDWGNVSASSGVSTVEVADYTAAVMLAGLLPRSVVELPIHLIGHSRGASLMVTLARNLGRAGLWVEQLTGLDAHPVDGVREPPLANFNWGDAPMETYANVVYADSYYRPSSGGLFDFDFGGEPIPGAANFGPLSLPGGSSLDHSDVHAYYHGTIDRDATSNSAGGPIEAAWYPSNAARATAGFDRSRVGRAARLPEGVGVGFGGTGARTAVSITAAEWYSNVGQLKIDDADGVLSTGESAAVSYRYQESHTTAGAIAFSIDDNTNPYDGPGVSIGSQSAPSTAVANAVASHAFNLPALPDGIYRVLATITNADGKARHAYAETPIAVAGGVAMLTSKQFTGEIAAAATNFAEPRNFAPGGLPGTLDRVLLSQSTTTAVSSRQVLAGLALLDDATLQLTDSTATLRMSSLLVGEQARLDIGPAGVVVDYDLLNPAPTLQQRIASAFAGGAWNGLGITATNLPSGGAVGIAIAADALGPTGGAFAGEPVDASTVLIRRTIAGDANLDLAVTLDDFTALAANFGQTGRIFGQGDFDYDGGVTLDDFTRLAANFGAASTEEPTQRSSVVQRRTTWLEAKSWHPSRLVLLSHNVSFGCHDLGSAQVVSAVARI